MEEKTYMAYDLPTAWKMDGLELSIEQKLNYLAAHVAALEAGGGGSTISVTAEYTEQTYNNKLATITVDDTATKIFAPKVAVTTNSTASDGPEIASIKVGNSTSHIYSVNSSTVYVEEDIDGTVGLFSANWTTIYNGAGSMIFAVCVPTADTNTMYYLEKVWSETDAQTFDTVYYAKFGSKTYSATSDDVPLELVTT